MSDRSPSPSKLRFLFSIPAVAAGLLPVVGWVGGGFWFFDLFNHFQVQYAWFLSLCLMVLLAMRAFRAALVAGLLLMVPVVRIVPGYVSPEAVAGGASSIRIASFNVLASNRDHAAALRWTRETLPDAIFFTEVNEPWAEALRELEGDYPHWINEGPDFAFFSKYPIEAWEAPLSSSHGFPILKARLATPGGPVTFFAGHPLPPMTPDWAEAMDVFVGDLSRMIAAEPGRVIVAGDFNSSRWSWKTAPLLAGGLADVAKGKAPGATWNRGNPILGIPIDRILFKGQGMSCRSFVIGPDLNSDHRPVMAEIAW